MTFELKRNTVLYFDISKSYFDILTGGDFRILTFKILFWHSNRGRISYFDIQKSYFDIRNQAIFLILTFKILFWHSIWGGIPYFDIQYPILTLEIGPNIKFWHSNPILTFEQAEYRILTFKILFWHSNWGRLSYFDIQNPILTFELRPNIAEFWHSKSYFDIRNRAEYRILTFNNLFWHSKWGRLLYFDIQNPILTSELGRISYFGIWNPDLTFELRPHIVFCPILTFELGRICIYVFIYLFIQYFKRVTYLARRPVYHMALWTYNWYIKHGNKRTVICTYIQACMALLKKG